MLDFEFLVKEIYCDIGLLTAPLHFYNADAVRRTPLHQRNLTTSESVCQYPQRFDRRFGVQCCLIASAVIWCSCFLFFFNFKI